MRRSNLSEGDCKVGSSRQEPNPVRECLLETNTLAYFAETLMPPKKVLKQLATGEKLFWFIWLRFGIMIVNKNFNDRHFILSNRALKNDTHFSGTLVMIFLQRPAKKICYRSFQFLLTIVILKRNYLIWNNFPLVANLYKLQLLL